MSNLHFGKVADTVRAYNAANYIQNNLIPNCPLPAYGTGNEWDASLDRIDYCYALANSLGMNCIREFAKPRLCFENWIFAQKDSHSPLIITDNDGWEAVERVFYNSRKYGIKIVWEFCNPTVWTWNDYPHGVNGYSYHKMYPSWGNKEGYLNNWLIPVWTDFANRFKEYSDCILGIIPSPEADLFLGGWRIEDCTDAPWRSPQEAKPRGNIWYEHEGVYYIDPFFWDCQDETYEIFQQIAPEITVFLSGASHLGFVPRCLHQATWYDRGNGAGMSKYGTGRRLLDTFDVAACVSFYGVPATHSDVSTPTPVSDPLTNWWYNNVGTIRGINDYLASPLINRPDVKVGINEGGIFALKYTNMSSVNGSNTLSISQPAQSHTTNVGTFILPPKYLTLGSGCFGNTLYINDRSFADSNTAPLVNDPIAVLLDGEVNYWHWTTVTSVNWPTSIQIADAIPTGETVSRYNTASFGNYNALNTDLTIGDTVRFLGHPAIYTINNVTATTITLNKPFEGITSGFNYIIPVISSVGYSDTISANEAVSIIEWCKANPEEVAYQLSWGFIEHNTPEKISGATANSGRGALIHTTGDIVSLYGQTLSDQNYIAPPPWPLNVRATNVGTNHVTLQWDEPL